MRGRPPRARRRGARIHTHRASRVPRGASAVMRMRLPLLLLLMVQGALLQSQVPRKPACWFLHGAGEQCYASNGTVLPPEQCPGPSTTPDMMDGQPYWGDFRLPGGGGVEMPHCASLHYNHDDTVHQKFDASRLRQRVCRMLCGIPNGQPAAGCVITDSVIFTHSAANNYFASALMHGDCYLGGSSDWFSVAAPALGSKVADLAAAVCRTKALRDTTCEIHYCSDCSTDSSSRKDSANPMYVSLGAHYTNFEPLRATIEAHSSGSLCGVDANGIACPAPSNNTHCSTDDIGLCLLARLAYSTRALPALDCCSASSTQPVDRLGANCSRVGKPSVDDSDGMVGYSECALPGREYVEDWRSRWYKMQSNHEDATCVNGAGTGDSQQPCKWYQQMAQFAVEGSGSNEPNPLWRSPRPDRYSCRGDGMKACVRDPNGAHLNESACVAHCEVCSPSPCAHGGSCTAARTDSWQGAEENGGLPYHCSCIGSWHGDRCNEPGEVTSRDNVKLVLGVIAFVVTGFVLLASCVVTFQRRRRLQMNMHRDARLLGSQQMDGLSGSE